MSEVDGPRQMDNAAYAAYLAYKAARHSGAHG